MDKKVFEEFYSREDILKAILNFAKNRELGAQFGTYFGKRPDTIEYISDVKKLVKKGITSFHFSEERWTNPLLLSNKNLTDEEKNNNRCGWDLILDLDGVDYEYAKIIGKIIIDYLEEIGVRNVSTKFSGNKGFHIGIPYEAFSSNIIGIGKTSDLFPEAARKISMYLMMELEDRVCQAILDRDGSVSAISKKYGIDEADLWIEKYGEKKLNYLKLIEIDTILIASRHLFRAPYSFNEKSGLISIPVENKKIMLFEKEFAKPENVDPAKYVNYEFLKYNPNYNQDGNALLMRAYEEVTDDEADEVLKRHRKVFKAGTGEQKAYVFEGDIEFEAFNIEEEVDEKEFPETVKWVLNNKIADGKKRALFMLLTFLHSISWSPEAIKVRILDWDKNQDKPLGDKYLEPQLSWFEGHEKKISPPNFANDNYYKDIGIPKELIDKDIRKFKIWSKNPLHYIYQYLEIRKIAEENKKKKKKGGKAKKVEKPSEEASKKE